MEQERHEREEAQQRLEALPPTFVVHTVHGTFARKATWIEPESTLCQTLRENLGWRARIEPFRWSGRNSVNARARAADEFRAHLAGTREAFPEAEHLVIAHSHGGNVVLMALDTEARAEQVLGVVTLATPFLHAEDRSKSSEDLIDIGTGFFAGLFAGWAVLFYGFYRGMGWDLWPWALGAIGLSMLIMFLGAWAIERMRRHAQHVSHQMPSTALKPDQLSVVRVQGDEAIALLAGARLAGTLADLLWAITGARAFRVVDRLLNFIDYGQMRSWEETFRRKTAEKYFGASHSLGFTYPPPPSPLVAPPELFANSRSLSETFADNTGYTVGQVIFQVSAIGLTQAFQNGSPEIQALALSAAGLYALPAAFALGVVLLGVPFAFLSSASLFFCGFKMPFAGPYLHVTAEPSPLGTWSVTQFDASVQDGGLFHSKAYEDYRVPPFIAEWVQGRTRKDERPPVSAQPEAEPQV